MIHPLMFLQPFTHPFAGLFDSLQMAFELGNVHFLGQLTESRAGCGTQLNQFVAVEQRFGLYFEVLQRFYSLPHAHQGGGTGLVGWLGLLNRLLKFVQVPEVRLSEKFSQVGQRHVSL